MLNRKNMWERLDGDFDLVIIGGGINGAGIARDAIRRGLKVALVEQNDLAYGTSSRSSKLVHGGLRYLEQFQFGLVFESVSERGVLLKMAPHLVAPLGFIFPIYKGAKRPMFMISAGMFLYDALSLFRSPGRRRTLRARHMEREEPALQRKQLRGAPLYFDAATDDARLTLETAIDAAHEGAVVVTYARATGVTRANGRVSTLQVRCMLSGAEKSVRTKCIINATGPWTDLLLGAVTEGHRRTLRPTKGVHIVVPKAVLPLNNAVVMAHPADGRVLFAIPWGDTTYIGTTDTDFKGDPAQVYADGDDIAYLIESTSKYFPEHPIGRDDIISTWAGLRPLIGPPEGADVNESAVSREHHISTTEDGIVSVAGGKLTTYRLMSAETVEAAMAWLSTQNLLGAHGAKPETGQIPLPGAAGWETGAALWTERTMAAAKGAIEPDTAQMLVATYGVRAPRVAELAAQDRDLAQRLIAQRPEIMAQIEWGITEEFLTTVNDALKQRTQLYYRDQNQGLDAIPAVGAYMAQKLGWSDEHRARMEREYRDEVAASRAWQDDYEAAMQRREERRRMLAPSKKGR